jgi:hypothetical protein
MYRQKTWLPCAKQFLITAVTPYQPVRAETGWLIGGFDPQENYWVEHDAWRIISFVVTIMEMHILTTTPYIYLVFII